MLACLLPFCCHGVDDPYGASRLREAEPVGLDRGPL